MLQVYNPLQTSNVSLQGSTPVNSLQGNSQPLQGSAPVYGPAPVQTVVAPPKPAAVRKAAAAAPVQQPTPQQQPVQNYSFMNEKAAFDPNSGQTAVVGQTPAPAAPEVLDPGQQLARTAAQAGLSADDYLKLISGQSGISAGEQASIRSNLGIDALEKSLFAPSPSTEQIYKDAFAAAGLSDVKAKFDALQAKINTAHENLTKELGGVNENPWLSEASRVGRARRLQELASGEIENLSTQAQQYADLYNQGLEQVHGVVTRSRNDFADNQNLNSAKLTYLEKKAQEQIAAREAENGGKLNRYLPEFLSAKAKAAKPETVTDGNGQTYQYINGEFIPVGKPKSNLPASYQEYLLASADPNYNSYLTADANRKAIKISSGGAAGLNNSTLTKVQTIANQFDGEQIVKDFNVIQGKVQTVEQLLSGKLGGPGDLSVVYEFMKGLDPSSVVRETEYASAAKSGNIFAGQLAKFNGYLKPNGGFLPDAVKSSFLSILGTKLGTAQQQYQNLYDEYGRRINKLTGQADGTEYITDYAKAFSKASGSSAQSNPLSLPGF